MRRRGDLGLLERNLAAGSAAQFGAALVQAVKAEIVQRSFAPLAEKTDVRVSALGDNAVMLGAAALLLAHELGVV